jgi:quinol monooxygenase YgiN
MKIIIAGWLDLPADKAERIILHAQHLIEAGRAETGCIAYDWALDPAKPGRVQVYEEWADEAALQGHFDHSAYAKMGAALQAGPIMGFNVRKFLIADENTVYDGEGVPRADFGHAAAV